MGIVSGGPTALRASRNRDTRRAVPCTNGRIVAADAHNAVTPLRQPAVARPTPQEAAAVAQSAVTALIDVTREIVNTIRRGRMEHAHRELAALMAGMRRLMLVTGLLVATDHPETAGLGDTLFARVSSALDVLADSLADEDWNRVARALDREWSAILLQTRDLLARTPSDAELAS